MLIDDCDIINLYVIDKISLQRRFMLKYQLYSELDCDTSRNQVWDARVEDDIDVFLTRIIITKDDLVRYSDEIPECKYVRLKEPIFVDIYI